MAPSSTLVAWLLLAAPEAPTVVPFQGEVGPRLDPLFGDARSLRAEVDGFLSLQGDMDRAREDFSGAVHGTLGELLPGQRELAHGRCPEAARAAYQRAHGAGERFLALGSRMDSRFRSLRRAEDLGDVVALTPDYRWKIRRSREIYAQLLRDFREMRVAFHDQLGAEMSHAGCEVTPPPRPGARPAGPAPAREADPDPLDAAAWALSEPAGGAAGGVAETLAPGATGPRGRRGPPGASTVAPPARIEIDNGRCGEPVRLSVDGVATAEIGAGRRSALLTHSGPHELCLLPASDTRPCGAPGTVRKAYLHDGWSLSVRCGR